MKTFNLKKLTLTAIFAAIAVVGSLFSFPVFGSKCAPIQHLVNILCAVTVGPWWGLAQAFTASVIRNLLGLGMAFLGGVFVPQNMLSDEVLAVARFLPTYWYVRANNMLAGFSTEIFDMHLYWNAIGIQLLFALTAFALTLVASKLKHQAV